MIAASVYKYHVLVEFECNVVSSLIPKNVIYVFDYVTRGAEFRYRLYMFSS